MSAKVPMAVMELPTMLLRLEATATKPTTAPPPSSAQSRQTAPKANANFCEMRRLRRLDIRFLSLQQGRARPSDGLPMVRLIIGNPAGKLKGSVRSGRLWVLQLKLRRECGRPGRRGRRRGCCE